MNFSIFANRQIVFDFHHSIVRNANSFWNAVTQTIYIFHIKTLNFSFVHINHHASNRFKYPALMSIISHRYYEGNCSAFVRSDIDRSNEAMLWVRKKKINHLTSRIFQKMENIHQCMDLCSPGREAFHMALSETGEHFRGLVEHYMDKKGDKTQII